MKNFKNRISITVFAFALVFLMPLKSFSTILIHIGDEWFIGEGTCDGWCPDAPAMPTCLNLSTAFNAQTDYIQVQNGFTYVITKERKIKIISDIFLKFISSTKKKYINANKSDKTVVQNIQAEYNAFLKIDNGKIRADRLALIVKATGLKIKVNEADLQKQR
jgi:hypothetical protein